MRGVGVSCSLSRVTFFWNGLKSELVVYTGTGTGTVGLCEPKTVLRRMLSGSFSGAMRCFGVAGGIPVVCTGIGRKTDGKKLLTFKKFTHKK
jgi:hypothetical protein